MSDGGGGELGRLMVNDSCEEDIVDDWRSRGIKDNIQIMEYSVRLVRRLLRCKIGARSCGMGARLRLCKRVGIVG